MIQRKEELLFFVTTNFWWGFVLLIQNPHTSIFIFTEFIPAHIRNKSTEYCIIINVYCLNNNVSSTQHWIPSRNSPQILLISKLRVKCCAHLPHLNAKTLSTKSCTSHGLKSQHLDSSSDMSSERLMLLQNMAGIPQAEHSTHTHTKPSRRDGRTNKSSDR